MENNSLDDDYNQRLLQQKNLQDYKFNKQNAKEEELEIKGQKRSYQINEAESLQKHNINPLIAINDARSSQKTGTDNESPQSRAATFENILNQQKEKDNQNNEIQEIYSRQIPNQQRDQPVPINSDGRNSDPKFRYTKRVKLRARYNEQALRFDIKEKVKVFLEHYNIDFNEFEGTLITIESDVNLRPFHNQAPLCRRILYKVLSLLILLMSTYVCFIILQLALLNLIILVVMLIYLGKFYRMMNGLEQKATLKFKYKALNMFIENENLRYYRALNVELVADEDGRLIELQLPDDIDDFRKKHKILSRQQSRITVRGNPDLEEDKDQQEPNYRQSREMEFS
ncbi:UNKNOWN [Stylonychia lemnae]|uniref:Transmembrane protein n=1 Tax=Stylonychia lemnae TaxID=5949 RepID=A0A077ZM28_STYLE|nr:UNKNOWN [Stylonychia lemnae]|eukprot:CDW71062.1 UNKNOWN [Stylonychia lemnae]